MVINKARHPNLKLKSHNEGGWQSIKFDFYCFLRKSRERLSQAHKKHAYQRLSQAGWSHYKVTNYSIMLNILLFAIVYFISNIFASFIISLIVLLFIIKYIDYKKAFV